MSMACGDQLGRRPVVVEAGGLLRDPEKTLRALCAALDLDFQQSMLSWEPGPRPEDGCWAAWWYASVHASNGWRKAEDGATPRNGHVEELPPLSPQLQAVLEQCLPVYEKLKKHAINL
mmetsp:Transcript_6211/g.22853  ORF Transcript_6211/g.22853 Transcript_6211/m.22853 type:complete len:118 (-) Transcript_6211:2806-3159(-)